MIFVKNQLSIMVLAAILMSCGVSKRTTEDHRVEKIEQQTERNIISLPDDGPVSIPIMTTTTVPTGTAGNNDRINYPSVILPPIVYPSANDEDEDEEKKLEAAKIRRPDNYAGLYWLGDGYDVILGARKESCFKSEAVSYRAYPVMQSSDQVDVVFTTDELARKLSVDYNVEASGIYEGVTYTPSIKTSILRETNLGLAAMVAVAEFKYVKEKLSVYGSQPELSDASKALLASDPEAFRRQCGDKFTRSITTGATLTIVFTATHQSLTVHDTQSIESALKVGVGELFKVDAKSTLSADQKNILSSLRISTRCYSQGVSANPCAENQLNLSSVTLGDQAVLDRISQAKKTLAKEIADGESVASLREEFEHYPAPEGMASNQVYVDYKGKLAKVQEWLKVEQEVRRICQSELFRGLDDDCNSSYEEVSEGLAMCAEQANWSLGRCKLPSLETAQQIRSLGDAGEVTLYEHGDLTGTSLKLNLGTVLNPKSAIEANVIYNLRDLKFKGLADKISVVTADLKHGWQLVLFEHADGQGKTFTIDDTLKGEVHLTKFNDKASSFKIERIPSL